jgi:hypothetical protein
MMTETKLCEFCGDRFPRPEWARRGQWIRRRFCGRRCALLGAAHAALPAPIPVRERLWAKVDRDGPLSAYRPDLGACWLWTGSLDASGYGRLSVKNVPLLAHRLAYEDARGPVPDGLQLDHLCRVHGCCRPSHMEPVTNQENAVRGVVARAAGF